MNGWHHHSGIAVNLPQNNIDTDQIIPARFMSQPRAEGYEDFLLYDVRRIENGELNPDFPLNRIKETSVLLCGHNFGSGSSREAAAYALYDAGIRVVIATGFGDIFSANAVNNGLLPATISTQVYDALASVIGNTGTQCHIDLNHKSIAVGDQQFSFDIEESWRTKLINGWDDIDLTLQHKARIESFNKHYRLQHPWAWPENQSS